MKEQEDKYYALLQKDKDGQFYLNILSNGTMVDRISALSTIIQRNPQSSLSYLATLINLSKKKNRKQVEAAINQARDLFTDVLLPDDKKLTSFSKNPTLNKQTKDQSIILSAFYEHRLKELYSEYISVLKGLASDDLEFYRKFALNALQGCLEKKPEQEELILEILVNKLGDTSKKVQCHTIYLLLKLSQAHIEMTEVVVNSVSLFIGRSKEQSHIFYSVAYLNRIAQMVAPKDDKVRLMLLRIYFSLFRKVLKNDEESKAEVIVKKDRSKSKQQNKQAAKIKKANFKPDQLDQEDNKVAELVLKGVNILVTKCSQ